MEQKNIMTLEEKQELNKMFETMSDVLKYYVFLIIKKNGINYTQNENGIFFNDDNIDETLFEIKNFIETRIN